MKRKRPGVGARIERLVAWPRGALPEEAGKGLVRSGLGAVEGGDLGGIEDGWMEED